MATPSIMNFLVKAGVIVGSGGLIFGYDIGVIAGTISQLQTRYMLTVHTKNSQAITLSFLKFIHRRQIQFQLI